MTVANEQPRQLPLPWIQTPLVRSATLSELAGCEIYLKLDNIQPSGSFKSRQVRLKALGGVGNLIRKAALSSRPGSPLHFYASSGGNAGLACVSASVLLSYPCTIVVPLSTKPFMIDKLKKAGASEVKQVGATWFDADKYLREVLLKEDENGVYVPPFDHPDIWEGAESLADEIVRDLGEVPSGVVCSVGGGGLLIGLCQGLDRLDASHNAQVVAVETYGAESLHEAVKAGELVTLPGITSIATSLGAVRVASKAFDYGMKEHVHSTLVTDKEAAEACARFLDDERILVEPACGATLAMVYSGRLKEILSYKEHHKVVLEVCGGSAISSEILAGYKQMFDF
ncbi:L-serine ammonia-lyase [Cryptococcus wingfieldii CBS 7118]|uniref:L-serine ammonia-lyase n=1 Tax=Cryptococcus wingfieldii CBS 7118 TaxID=1295528 RepID=A0A1E3JLL8_9TREE|nr:L-serine ammonia-lyase [Cryptococcus wingfieldii CBS 7118]ODO00822.1 L-serine ammonia-lyase [Cryptococcus wingfieldii CBS 7118]